MSDAPPVTIAERSATSYVAMSCFFVVNSGVEEQTMPEPTSSLRKLSYVRGWQSSIRVYALDPSCNGGFLIGS